jgi:seryl-tRNA synthetase
MLDIKELRDQVETIIARLQTRKGDFSYLREVVQWDEERRAILQRVEERKNFRNEQSRLIGQYKRANKDAAPLLQAVEGIGIEIAQMDQQVNELESKIQAALRATPNLPNPQVPLGQSEEDNREILRHGKPRAFTFAPLPHWDLGTRLQILDFERAAKVSGARFTFYKGMGARLERALINFMMDTHANYHGCVEMLPPYLVNANSMMGTGQLPKFAEDAFLVEKEGYYLIPTAEVPVTNYHANEILDANDFPIKYVAYSGCFRSEAGSAGRDTRGIIRQHQFNKVELVRFALPEHSYQDLEELTAEAEDILQRLELPYRKILLCTADMGFSSAMTYDLEVWLPSYQAYKEISSCSNFEDFQARRANIRFRRDPKGKTEFVHTLNGSGLAVGRTLAAILENYQQEDGSILVPKALIPYMGIEVIR